jgi:Na+/proline symporter
MTYKKASVLKDFDKKNTIGDYKWDQLVLLCVVSMFAIFLLPRQFHTAIIENNKETHKDSYLAFPCIFAFQHLCISIAWEAIFYFESKGHNSDYSLLIPQLFDNNVLTIMVLGGFRQLFQ